MKLIFQGISFLAVLIFSSVFLLSTQSAFADARPPIVNPPISNPPIATPGLPPGKKPFKRVMVVSGGGINPGIVAGLVGGAQEMGWNPDLIIATCGSSLGAMILSSEVTVEKTLQTLKSPEFFRALNLLQVNTHSLLKIQRNFKHARQMSIYPDIFENTILKFPNKLHVFLEHKEFNTEPDRPKMIFVGAKALFKQINVGSRRSQAPLFQQVYFTDPVTGQYLNGLQIKDEHAFPKTNIQKETETITHFNIFQAMRSGIGDPYLLDPSYVEGNAYFTGAVDLYPLDLAESLGEEVVATYPQSLFNSYEKLAIKAPFGFNPNQKALEAIQHTEERWVDVTGLDDIGFNPTPHFLLMKNQVPKDYAGFKAGIQRQWKFGHDRAVEMFKASGDQKNVRTHLRRPISPALLHDFSCASAFAWETDKAVYCKSDKKPGCDRAKARECYPIR